MKKDRNYYLNLPYQMIVQKIPQDKFYNSEFVAFYKEYPKITGIGDNENEAIKELKEAFECFIVDALKSKDFIKEPEFKERKERINVLLRQSTLKKISEKTKNRSKFLDLAANYVLSHNISLDIVKNDMV